MFDFVHKNPRLVQGLLALLILPFAFVGVDSYVRSMDSDKDVAKVGGQPVTAQEFDNAMRNQQARMQQAMGKNYDAAMFDTPEARQSVLDSVINQRLLQEQARGLNLTGPDTQLRKLIAENPEFQDAGKFSEKRYDEVLRNNNLTRLSYEQNLRSSLAQQPIQDVFRTNFVSKAQALQYQTLTEQGREVQVAMLEPTNFLANAKVDDAAVKAEYDKNPDAYRAPEQVKLEYVQMGQAAFMSQITVTPEELKAEFDKRTKEFSTPEERRASHVLISIDKDDKGQPKAGAKEAAKAEADAVYKQVTASPEKFAEIAKAKSKDPGSAAQGGDLGFFGHGAMVKPFDEAVFAMKPNEIRGPIESDFGYHIIHLTEIKAEKLKPFEEVRAQLEGDIKQQRANKKFSESAEKFQNRVYEQPDSYARIAEDLKLDVKKTDWLTRAQAQALAGGNDKFVQTVFSPAQLASKKNSEAVDLGNNNVISARVLEHKPSVVRPFEEVKAQITTVLQRKAATELAVKAGAEKLTAAKAGKFDGLNFSAAQKVLRQNAAPGVSTGFIKQIFAADLSKGTAVVGAANDNGGYTIAKVLKVVEPTAAAPEALKALTQRLEGQSTPELGVAYLAALKNDIKVEIKKGALTPAKVDGAKDSTEPGKAAAPAKS